MTMTVLAVFVLRPTYTTYKNGVKICHPGVIRLAGYVRAKNLLSLWEYVKRTRSFCRVLLEATSVNFIYMYHKKVHL